MRRLLRISGIASGVDIVPTGWRGRPATVGSLTAVLAAALVAVLPVGLLLFVITLVFNVISIRLVRRFREAY